MLTTDETPLQSKPKCRKPNKEIVKCPANLEEAVPQMQPTYDEREKKINFPHILCVLEEDEAKNLVKRMETRENSITNDCDQNDCGELRPSCIPWKINEFSKLRPAIFH